MPSDEIASPAMVRAESGADAFRMAASAAELCGELVKATAQTIQGRKYVSIDGWQAIAVAHGYVASAADVSCEADGVRAIGEVRRRADGVVVARGEGFVGKDEPRWFGGEGLPKRPDFAIRAMAQTRAIARACRATFAHVVVMIDADLQTTPAEEMRGLPELGGASDWVEEARKDGLIKDGETRSQYQVDKLRKAVDAGWRVRNTTPKGRKDQLFAYLDMARHTDDVSAVCEANAELIAQATYKAEFESAVERLLRRFEQRAAPVLP
ncbi:MAG: hypothetical protein JOY64_05330 [Alphaproteobacteria bacterium]|nr:hypothetical protein [Alphaproteobacteria bacterium]MBV8407031.1 hypothetical protein [Alphaproteobacteria bacterium]